MQVLVQARWFLLAAAFVCALVMALPWIYPAHVYWGLPLDWAFPAVGVLQAIGVFAMHRAGASRLWVIVGAISAVAWLVSYSVAGLAVEAGPGGLVYGLLIVLPAQGIGFLTQAAALIGFALHKPNPQRG